MAVTLLQLVTFLFSLRGATFATIRTRTDARARKTGNPYGRIFKVATYNGQLNYIYDNAVRAQLLREGKNEEDYVPGKSWHEPIIREDGTLTPLASKKGKKEPNYLRFRLLKVVAGPVYFAEDGQELTVEQVRPFVDDKSDSYSNQGTDKKIIALTYGLDSIEELATEGIVFRVS